MSTSPSLATENTAPGAPILEAFPYDSVSAIGMENFRGQGSSASASTPFAADTTAREASAHAQGFSEGQSDAQKRFEEQLARERSGLAQALSQFTLDRAGYFEKIEGEVVQLALSIARKILHREAQVDPLLLAGIVRVALERVEGATGVVLRVHPQNATEWRRFLSLQLDPADLPEIVEDPSQAPDSCVLETAMGTAVVGIEAQLKEIEQGLMDLLTTRPGGGR